MQSTFGLILRGMVDLQGWIAGDFSVEDGFCRKVVKTLKCLAISIHYRLYVAQSVPCPVTPLKEVILKAIQ